MKHQPYPKRWEFGLLNSEQMPKFTWKSEDMEKVDGRSHTLFPPPSLWSRWWCQVVIRAIISTPCPLTLASTFDQDSSKGNIRRTNGISSSDSLGASQKEHTYLQNRVWQIGTTVCPVLLHTLTKRRTQQQIFFRVVSYWFSFFCPVIFSKVPLSV